MSRKPSGTWAPLPAPRNAAWEEASRDRDLSAPTPYEPALSYRHGQVIVHSKFGLGVVMGVSRPGQMIVVFTDRTRKLLMGRNKAKCGRRGA